MIAPKDLITFRTLIREEIDAALDPIVENIHDLGNDMQTVKKGLDILVNKTDTHAARLDTLTSSVVRIENTLGGFSDAYELNRGRLDDHETRISKIERSI